MGKALQPQGTQRPINPGVCTEMSELSLYMAKGPGFPGAALVHWLVWDISICF